VAGLRWRRACACCCGKRPRLGALLLLLLLLHGPGRERGSQPVSFRSCHTRCCRCCCWRCGSWRCWCVEALAQALLLFLLLLLLLYCPARILTLTVIILENFKPVGCRPDNRGKHALLLELGARPRGRLAAVLLGRGGDAGQQRVLLQGGREGCWDGALPCRW
jgi:hypothetical protein